jgi:hypothetical protein
METFRELTLADKNNFDRLLTKIQPESSDLNFSNLWMWAKAYGLTVTFLTDPEYWLLLARPLKWKPFFFAPVGDWTDWDKLEMVLNCLKQMAAASGMQFLMRRTPRKMVEMLLRLDPNLQYREDRNTYDYLYTTEALLGLAGRKLHSKRNQLNQFLRKYQWTYQPLDREIVAECLELKTPWFDLRENASGENEAMLRLLGNFDQLGVVGGVIRVDGRIQALTVGEQLNRETALVHIEKANTDFNGIYAAINQQFVSNQWQQLTYINREEDMGIPGLRQVKLSYQPAQLIEKFSVY